MRSTFRALSSVTVSKRRADAVDGGEVAALESTNRLLHERQIRSSVLWVGNTRTRLVERVLVPAEVAVAPRAIRERLNNKRRKKW